MPPPRRSFLSRALALAMTASLVAGYGTFGWIAGRFLLPTRATRRGWLFVADVESFRPGTTLPFVAPTGERIVVARRDDGGFMALSSTCPHLGCQVTWQAAERRFFCPCHNGTFAPDGRATGGPPFEAGQSLPSYPLRVASGLLYIEVALAAAAGSA